MPRARERRRWKIATIIGTRPEVIKCAPLVAALKKTGRFQVFLFSSGQHRHLLNQTLEVFGIHPDHDCRVMTHSQSLFDIAHRAFPRLKKLLLHFKPDLILVQGDTSTAFIAALAGFYTQIPVGHVEAGLRTRDLSNPFPEEANRRLVSVLASLHFAPTPSALRNLVQEGVPQERIFVTGNTVIDALRGVLRSDQLTAPSFFSRFSSGRPLLLVTVHRRENFGAPLRRICEALKQIAGKGRCEILLPVHENPQVKKTVYSILGGVPSVHLVRPLDYFQFVYALKRCRIVLSDSGGVQEESAFLGKPILVLREKTERPEVLEEGLGKLVGSNPSRIIREVSMLLEGSARYRRQSQSLVFGDGKASSRIAALLRSFLENSPHKLTRPG